MSEIEFAHAQNADRVARNAYASRDLSRTGEKGMIFDRALNTAFIFWDNMGMAIEWYECLDKLPEEGTA